MEATILDYNFRPMYNIDIYESLIWTERYIGYGDFELYMPMSYENFDKIQQDWYIRLDDSDTIMIIEDIEIVTNFEEGSHLKVTGRSLESILDRRIVWKQIRFQNRNVQNVIKKLITDAIIDPTDADRKISNFVFKEVDWLDVEIPSGDGVTDEEISAAQEIKDYFKISKEYTGDNIYDVVVELCQIYDIGFKIYYDNETGQFVFTLYRGNDRTYDATAEVPRVIFSPAFDNLANSNYINARSGYKNVTLVMGEEPEGEERIRVTVGNTTGLDRRELYTDARDIQRKQEDDTVLELAPYRNLLRKRGQEKLDENKQISSFDAEIDPVRGFIYGKDYFIGDVVQIENEWGITAIIEITEVVRSIDKEGYSLYPTFKVLE